MKPNEQPQLPNTENPGFAEAARREEQAQVLQRQKIKFERETLPSAMGELERLADKLTKANTTISLIRTVIENPETLAATVDETYNPVERPRSAWRNNSIKAVLDDRTDLIGVFAEANLNKREPNDSGDIAALIQDRGVSDVLCINLTPSDVAEADVANENLFIFAKSLPTKATFPYATHSSKLTIGTPKDKSTYKNFEAINVSINADHINGVQRLLDISLVVKHYMKSGINRKILFTDKHIALIVSLYARKEYLKLFGDNEDIENYISRIKSYYKPKMFNSQEITQALQVVARMCLLQDVLASNQVSYVLYFRTLAESLEENFKRFEIDPLDNKFLGRYQALQLHSESSSLLKRIYFYILGVKKLIDSKQFSLLFNMKSKEAINFITKRAEDTSIPTSNINPILGQDIHELAELMLEIERHEALAKSSATSTGFFKVADGFLNLFGSSLYSPSATTLVMRTLNSAMSLFRSTFTELQQSVVAASSSSSSDTSLPAESTANFSSANMSSSLLLSATVSAPILASPIPVSVVVPAPLLISTQSTVPPQQQVEQPGSVVAAVQVNPTPPVMSISSFVSTSPQRPDVQLPTTSTVATAASSNVPPIPDLMSFDAVAPTTAVLQPETPPPVVPLTVTAATTETVSSVPAPANEAPALGNPPPPPPPPPSFKLAASASTEQGTASQSASSFFGGSTSGSSGNLLEQLNSSKLRSTEGKPSTNKKPASSNLTSTLSSVIVQRRNAIDPKTNPEDDDWSDEEAPGDTAQISTTEDASSSSSTAPLEELTSFRP